MAFRKCSSAFGSFLLLNAPQPFWYSLVALPGTASLVALTVGLWIPDSVQLLHDSASIIRPVSSECRPSGRIVSKGGAASGSPYTGFPFGIACIVPAFGEDGRPPGDFCAWEAPTTKRAIARAQRALPQI